MTVALVSLIGEDAVEALAPDLASSGSAETLDVADGLVPGLVAAIVVDQRHLGGIVVVSVTEELLDDAAVLVVLADAVEQIEAVLQTPLVVVPDEFLDRLFEVSIALLADEASEDGLERHNLAFAGLHLGEVALLAVVETSFDSRGIEDDLDEAIAEEAVYIEEL